MLKLSTRTINSDHFNDFNETIKWSLLMCANIQGNNNKFYCIEVQKNDKSEYVLFSHYGRLSGQIVEGGCYDIRGPVKDLLSLEKEYDKIIKHKLKPKSKTRNNGDKYIEKYELVDVLQPTVGSSNIKKKKGSTAIGVSKKSVDLSNLFSSFGDIENKLLNQLYQENVHQITSSTNIKMTSNGLETPLGPLTDTHLDKAKIVLDNLNQIIDTSKSSNLFSDKNFKDLHNQYFSLIPRSVGYRLLEAQLINNTAKVIEEYDLLEQMKSALQLQNSDIKEDHKMDFGFKIKLANNNTKKLITEHYNDTRNHSNLNNYKVANVYEIHNEKERKRYVDNVANFYMKHSNEEDRKQYDLFHGSRNANVLSIMLNGFNVPPVNAPHVTGRMFGNGVYAANKSTKALNYSLGNWNRSVSNKYPNIFLFITKFAMGKIYETKKGLSSGTPAGYNSIFAKGGADLRNDEYIVPNVAQTTTTHLIELTK